MIPLMKHWPTYLKIVNSAFDQILILPNVYFNSASFSCSSFNLCLDSYLCHVARLLSSSNVCIFCWTTFQTFKWYQLPLYTVVFKRLLWHCSIIKYQEKEGHWEQILLLLCWHKKMEAVSSCNTIRPRPCNTNSCKTHRWKTGFSTPKSLQSACPISNLW